MYSDQDVGQVVQGLIPGTGKVFLFSENSQICTGGHFPGGKAAGCASNAEVKNEWSYPSTPPYMLSSCAERQVSMSQDENTDGIVCHGSGSSHIRDQTKNRLISRNFCY